MSNFFNDDEPASEYDMLQLSEDDTYPETEEEAEEVYSEDQDTEEMVQDISQSKPSYSLNKQERSVVSEAMLRLEQARLYEMLLKHDFFGGVRVNPVAKQNVEQELKKYILDRLEILLGIKSETVQSTSTEVTIDLPFNDVEVEFLKALAYKGTNGASYSSVPTTQTVTSTPKINSLPKVQEQQGLRPLTQFRPAQQIQKQMSKPVQKPQPVQNRPPVKAPVKQVPRPVKAGPKKARSLEEIAREDIEKMKNRKPAHEMTPKELKAANKQVEGGGSRRYAAGAIPMPTAEQQINQIIISKSSQSKSSGFNDILSKALGSVPIETVSDDY